MTRQTNKGDPRATGADIESVEQMTARIIDSLSTAFLLLDEKLKILSANQAAENMLRESITHMKGRCVSEIIVNGGDLLATVRKAIVANQLYTRRQMSLGLPGKGEVTADITVTPIADQNQVLVEFVPMDRYLRIDRDATIKEHHDVTRQMVRGFAHEVKNPLGGIKGSAQLLARELPDESLQEYTNIIIEETDRLTSLVDRMLGPNTPPQKRLISIHEVLERAAKLIELESDDTLVVTRDYDPSIPELSVDPEMMVQAFLNVVRNAMQCLKTTPDPEITLLTRIERQFTIIGKRHRVVLKVEITDNGPGIPAEIQEHLFYPMISGRPGGTGLGLTFAQSIISQHAGMIEFESEPGHTCFRILIPLEQTS